MGFNTHFNMDFLGKTIKDLRLEAGLSQGDVSKKSGIDRHALSAIENCRIVPMLDTLIRLGDGLNQPAWYILQRAQERMTL